MKRTLRHWVAALFFATTIGGTSVAVASPQISFAICGETVLTFPAWYKGLTEPEPGCGIVDPNKVGGLTKFIGRIGLNVIEFMLQLVGYISVGYIIVGGYKYIIASGTPDKMAGARKAILNAVIGLAISIFSVAIVNLAAGAFK